MRGNAGENLLVRKGVYCSTREERMKGGLTSCSEAAQSAGAQWRGTLVSRYPCEILAVFMGLLGARRGSLVRHSPSPPDPGHTHQVALS